MVLLTAVLNSAFVLRFPRLRQYPNRWQQAKETLSKYLTTGKKEN